MYVPLPMQRIGYSAIETLQSYEIYLGKENIIEEKDKICYLSNMLPTHFNNITCDIVYEKG